MGHKRMPKKTGGVKKGAAQASEEVKEAIAQL